MTSDLSNSSSSSSLDNPFPVSPKKKGVTILEARCPDCLKEFRKTRALKSFSKCSKVKDFVRIMDNTAKLAGFLLLKQSTGDLSAEDADRLKKAQSRLADPAAQKRYDQVLQQRKNSKKNAKKAPVKSLEERAQLDMDIEVPPSRIDLVEEGSELDDGEISICA